MSRDCESQALASATAPRWTDELAKRRLLQNSPIRGVSMVFVLILTAAGIVRLTGYFHRATRAFR